MGSLSIVIAIEVIRERESIDVKGKMLVMVNK
jgi:hypothetical protein